ncbi:MAG: hypothetical protein ACYTEL_17070 [Planctomycetota bacterium]|jgi:hypothetical protein
MDQLCFENVKSTKPKEMHGDLYVAAEGFYFLAFCKVNQLALALQVNLGLIGAWLMHRSDKKRALEMQQWRQGHGQRFLDELAEELEGSWVVPAEQIKLVKPRFASTGVVVESVDGRKLSVETQKKQLKEIQEFARSCGWPTK